MIEYWLWLSTREQIGIKGALALLDAFGSPEEIFFADSETLKNTAGVSPTMLPALLDKNLLSSKQILSSCYEKNIRILTLQDNDYPSALRAIDDPPLLLYCLGKLPYLEDRPVIGIVGARNASAYGCASAERLGYQLHSGGCTIISGMAAGIDSAAMRGALKAGDRVIAVLGCGVDVVYPRSGKELYRELLTRGCILSEYPPGTAPLAANFPPRNRIISGLSDGVLVVEAAKKSGSLITAECALAQNRDLFAVPGNIGVATCEGSNRLLQEGAALVQSSSDILDTYRYRYPETVYQEEPPRAETTAEKLIDIDKSIIYIDFNKITKEVSEDGAAVLRVLGTKELTLDELCAETELPAGKLLGTLTLLEIKGYLEHCAGSRYRVRRQSDEN